MDQKKPKVKLYMGLFIAFIMITSVFGFIASYRSEKATLSMKYNGFAFYKSQKGLYTRVGGDKVFFNYDPHQLEDIELSPEITDKLKGAEVLGLAYNPDSEYKKTLGGIQYEFSMVLEKVMDIIVQRGLADNKGYKLDMISCENATVYSPVIFFKDGENEGFMMEGDCVIVTAEDDIGFLRMYNRLLYGMLEVIQ